MFLKGQLAKFSIRALRSFFRTAAQAENEMIYEYTAKVEKMQLTCSLNRTPIYRVISLSTIKTPSLHSAYCPMN